ncbi:MAG: hypothetical protein HKL84_06600 [Acidimicrobiaceae bacterium]|nr:hypothetical protein [Acidimicrobiaceae bacterium]
MDNISARVQVTDSRGLVVADITSGTNGTFYIPLQPGHYTVIGVREPNGPGMFVKSTLVTVTKGVFAPVIVTFDTGIR